MEFDAKYQSEKIVEWIRDWFENHSGNAKGIVIGISGGKDSTVVAALCAKAIGKDKVFGVLMPNDHQSDIKDSIKVCQTIGIGYKIVNIGDIYAEILATLRLEDISLSFHTRTNIPPRIRMTILYAIGQELSYRVAGTGNVSEAFVGYFTKWGDGAYDFNPIANLTAEQVVAVGDALGLPYELVHKTPSDGLCGKSDEENLGFSYKDVSNYINYGICKEEGAANKIRKMHEYNAHKLSQPMKYMMDV